MFVAVGEWCQCPGTEEHGVGVPDPLTGGRLDTGAEDVGMLDVPVSSMLTAMGVPDPVVEVDAPESTKMSF